MIIGHSHDIIYIRKYEVLRDYFIIPKHFICTL